MALYTRVLPRYRPPMMKRTPTPVQWRRPRPGDPFVRDRDDWVAEGFIYVYTYQESRRVLRRFDRDHHTMDAVLASVRPATTLRLAQCFYHKHKSIRRYVREWRPRDAAPPLPVRSILVPPRQVQSSVLPLIYARITGDPSPPPLTDVSSYTARVESLLERHGLVLVTRLPGRVGGLSVDRHLFIVAAAHVPEGAVLEKRVVRAHRGDGIEVMVSVCPHGPETVRAQLWARMTQCATVGEFRDQVTETQARMLLWWEDHGLIRFIARPASGPEPA